MGDACWLAGPPREGDAAGICGDAGGAQCRPSSVGATRLVCCFFGGAPGREGVMLDSGAIDDEGASLSEELGPVVPLPLARRRAAEPGAVMAAAARRWLSERARRCLGCTCDAARVACVCRRCWVREGGASMGSCGKKPRRVRRGRATRVRKGSAASAARGCGGTPPRGRPARPRRCRPSSSRTRRCKDAATGPHTRATDGKRGNAWSVDCAKRWATSGGRAGPSVREVMQRSGGRSRGAEMRVGEV